MQILFLILFPVFTGMMCFFMKSDKVRRMLLVFTAIIHLAVTAATWIGFYPAFTQNGWIGIDRAGQLFLSITSFLFLLTSFYTVDYLRTESKEQKKDFSGLFSFINQPEQVFTACLLFFLSTMSLVCVSRHFGLMWVGVEATTLSSAPLIYFHRHHRSLEATWKYLMICSVGIAIAMLGNIFLSVSLPDSGGLRNSLLLDTLLSNSLKLDKVWLKASFICFLVGYGTKMGLAPLHSWLPDAHSESPSAVSALLSGALLNCAFLGILRGAQVCIAGGQAALVSELMILFGLLSMAFAAVFIIGQSDFKRMLAYSSVEHMGILSIGIGLTGSGVFASLLHTVNHSLSKAALFLTAGNILSAYKTKNSSDISGMKHRLPFSALLWITGFLAITGMPPFGLFISEAAILKSAVDQSRFGIAAVYLLLLAVIFVGMATIFLKMYQGAPKDSSEMPIRENWLKIISPAIMLGIVFTLGFYLPSFLKNILSEAARILGDH